MDKRGWKRRIIKECKEAKTYQPYFLDVINILAESMAILEAAWEKYEEDGAKPVIKYTNKAKETNLVKHPSLVIILDLMKAVLPYYKSLGLTAIDFDKLKGNAKGNEFEGLSNIDKVIAEFKNGSSK